MDWHSVLRHSTHMGLIDTGRRDFGHEQHWAELFFSHWMDSHYFSTITTCSSRSLPRKTPVAKVEWDGSSAQQLASSRARSPTTAAASIAIAHHNELNIVRSCSIPTCFLPPKNDVLTAHSSQNPQLTSPLPSVPSPTRQLFPAPALRRETRKKGKARELSIACLFPPARAPAAGVITNRRRPSIKSRSGDLVDFTSVGFQVVEIGSEPAGMIHREIMWGRSSLLVPTPHPDNYAGLRRGVGLVGVGLGVGLLRFFFGLVGGFSTVRLGMDRRGCEFLPIWEIYCIDGGWVCLFAFYSGGLSCPLGFMLTYCRYLRIGQVGRSYGSLYEVLRRHPLLSLTV